MDVTERLRILKTTELFAHVSDKILASMQGKMADLRLSAGATLFNEGDPGDALYLIVEGDLGILSNGVEFATRHTGEYVGELALVDDSPRSATVQAKTDVLLLSLHRDDFQYVLATSPEVAAALLRLLVEKIRADTEQNIAIIRQQEQLHQDLARAYEIQTAMLPSEDLVLNWIHLTGQSQPATVVGGDYYDYFHLPNGSVSLAIGDVVGHGFYSGLLVAIVSSALRFQVVQDPTPATVHSVLSQVVRNYHHARMLMTFAYMVINPNTRTLSYTSAGHPYPYLYRNSEQRWCPLAIDSLPFGSFLDDTSHQIEIAWQPGDRLFMYTDGVTEALNEQEQMYGSDSLEHFLDGHASLPMGEMIASLFEQLDGYRQNRPADDDVTIVVVEFL